jgi:hypothetical protein
MSDKPEPKDLETVLARLQQEWQELVELLTSQGRSQERVLEVEKILLRDAAGQYRGKIGANPDGSADLVLSAPGGETWARLGVNRDGEAFLELKDKKGESSFKVAVGEPYPGAEAGLAITPPGAPGADTAPQPVMPAAEEPSSGLATSAPGPEAQPGDKVDFGLVQRLERLESQNRRRKFYGALILGVMGIVLVAMAYALFCPYRSFLSVGSLTVRDPNGPMRAYLGAEHGRIRLDLWDQQTRRATLGLGAQGAPHLAFYDREKRLRAEFNLGPDGEPNFALGDKLSLQGKKEPNAYSDSGHGLLRRGATSGFEEGTLSSSPVGQAAAISPPGEVEVEGKYVGSKTSNKYHYPTCKWVRRISPGNMIKFKSAAEAQAHHYVPCPVCKPPPLCR